mmetsp:Transcript_33201/g.51906  ORF Transcript_33201/g.51906 Transcript_33201/m.51906 type:complete len:199 (-) Transcript_33201:93-689(-)
MDYYDLDEILQDEEKVPVTFLNGGYRLGFLDPVRHDAQDDIQEDEVTDLPLWLARGLFNKNQVSVGLSKVYGQGVQNALQADASVVSFKSGPYYYDVALRMMDMVEEEERDVNLLPGPDCLLLKFYNERFRSVLTKSQNWSKEDLSAFTRTLTENEKALFAVGFHTQKDFDSWKDQNSMQIQQSDVLKSRKRKRGIHV